jgi:SAM-dependent methyltransferase
MFLDEDLIEKYVSLVQRHKKEGTVLDLGCGTGRLSVELAKKGYFVTATDQASDMLEVAYHNSVMSDVKINFFIHNILDTVNKDYDIITMSSDVINYMSTEEEFKKALHNVSLAMNKDSIFVFDFLRYRYLKKIDGHHEEVLLPDNVLIWDVTLTNVPGQVKHTLKIGKGSETHVQLTFPHKIVIQMLQSFGIRVIQKTKTKERFIYVCKKEI